MTFELRRMILGVDASLPLSEVDYKDLVRAREGLFESLAVEEKYDLLVRNFLAFERAVYDCALTNQFVSETSWSDFIEHIQAVNLALMNLLAMSRTYVDHIPQNLAAILSSDAEQIESFHNARRNEHASTLGYRVLYEVRNHVQHCGLPVHSISFEGGWLEGRDACRHVAIPYLSVTALEKKGDFKKTILEELRAIGDKIDLRLLVRQNMSSFGRLHKIVRELTNAKANEWDSLVLKWRVSFAAVHGDEIAGLSIVGRDAENNIMREQSLMDDMIERRKYLQLKNRPVINAEKHFITGQISA